MKPFFTKLWWQQRPRVWLAYVILCTVSWVGFFFIRILNWPHVEGKATFKAARKGRTCHDRRNVIIVSNHRTMFDSFVIGIIAYFPELLFWPSVAPYHLAASENYFTGWLAKLILSCLKALPVAKGRKDVKIMHDVMRLLPKANVHIFPSGRRSFEPLGSEAEHPMRPGIGLILAQAPDPKPLVIPVFIGGVEKIFGGTPGVSNLSRWFPRVTGVLRRPLVIFGDPITWDDLIAKHGNTRECWQAIAERIAERINALDPKRAQS
jgi:1-acyl-sn-glycerol-3-phosphate acyltransferase